MVEYTPEDFRQLLESGICDTDRIRLIELIAEKQEVELEVVRINGGIRLIVRSRRMNTEFGLADTISWCVKQFFPGSKVISISRTEWIWEYYGQKGGQV